MRRYRANQAALKASPVPLARYLLTGDRHEMDFRGDADTLHDDDLQCRIAGEEPLRRLESRRRSLNGAAGEEAQLKLIGQEHSGTWHETFTVSLGNVVADVLATWEIAYDRIAGIEDTIREVAG